MPPGRSPLPGRRNRSKDFRKYLASMDKDHGLANHEAAILCRKYQDGDLESVRTLILSNLPLVNTLCVKYQNQGIAFEEMKHIGIIGVMKAARRFDKKAGVPFKAYVVWWVRQGLTKAIHEQQKISQVPNLMMEELERIHEKLKVMEQANEREPSAPEINAFLDTKVYELACLKRRGA